LRELTPNSLKSLTIQVTSKATYDIALYATSYKDFETMPFFFTFQFMAKEPIKTA